MSYRIIPLTQGFVAIIDAKHFRRVNRYSWHTHKAKGTKKKPGEPYARATINGRKIYLHRFIMNAPEHMNVDHKNHQTLDCRESNLELTTHIENQQRRRYVQKARKLRAADTPGFVC